MPGTSGNANVAYSGTTTAGQFDTITLKSSSGNVEVVNMTGTDRLYFNVNSSANPTAGGADCYPVPAAISSYRVQTNPGQVIVKVFCNSVQDYAVVSAADEEE